MKTFKQIEQDAREFYPEWAKSFDPANILGLTDRENTMVAFATDFCEHEIANNSTSQQWIPVGERLPIRGIKVKCKLSHDIGMGTTEKVLHRMKHSGKWSDYNDYVTHWQPLPDKPNQSPPSGEK